MNPAILPVNIRVFRGLNLLEDARISDPGSFVTLRNIYRQGPGILASRPGSAVYSRGDVFNVIQAPQDTAPTSGNTNLKTSLTDIIFSSSVADATFAVTGNLQAGPRGMRPRIRPGPITQKVSTVAANQTNLPIVEDAAVNYVSIKPIRVNSLHRLYTNFGNRRFLVGAFDFEGAEGDRLFYVDESTSTPVTRLMAMNEMSVGAGGEWSFIDFYKEDPDDVTKNYYAIGSNQVGKPFVVQLSSSNKPVAALLDVEAEVSGDTQKLYAVNTMCVYNGSVVYGGYRRSVSATAAGTTDEKRDNFICFSAPEEPGKIASTDGELSEIRIGDSIYEPVTKVVVNSVSSDSQGIKGQLVVFTNKRVVSYDGLPPISGNPTGTAFHSVALSEVGCVAPKTVVQTPAGLMFLGTDGLVYIIPRFSNGGPLPVSRAIEPVFKHLSLTSQKQCAAVYDDGHYKISVPEVNYLGIGFTSRTNSPQPQITPYGNPGATVPSVQYWLDVREPPAPQIDFGFVWTGPHTGMKHSCYARGTSYMDQNVLFAGSAVDGTIFQASIEGLASDPSPATPTTLVPLVYEIKTGKFDAGDVHVDKSVHRMAYGLWVDAAVSVQATVEVSGEVLNATTGETFTDTFNPVGQITNGTTFAQFFLVQGQSFRFVEKQPSARKRGRTFSFRWLIAPSAATLIKYSDMKFTFEKHERGT